MTRRIRILDAVSDETENPQESNQAAGNGPSCDLEPDRTASPLEPGTCRFCGEFADTKDYEDFLSCLDCRSLGDGYTGKKRRQRIAKALRMRVIALGPRRWTRDEAEEELHGHLLTKVLGYIGSHDRLIARAQFANGRRS